MAKSLPDILYLRDKVTPVLDSPVSSYQIPYNKTAEYFANWQSYNQFVKSCEQVVRTNKRYKAYIAHLKNEVKLNHCQVFSALTDDDCSIEMHHGPIFNLFDYCSIVLEYYLIKKWKITTFAIADTVLSEHEKNHVQVVMLSTTAHEEVHNRNLFINYRQAYGDLNAFVKKYGIAMGPEHKEKFNRYIDQSLMRDSDDNGLFELSSLIYKYDMEENDDEL